MVYKYLRIIYTVRNQIHNSYVTSYFIKDIYWV